MPAAQSLGNNLILRPVRDDADRERFAAFNGACNNAFEGATCACLLHHHPATTADDYWIVEDTAAGEVVSSTCLIPWSCSFSGVRLRVAQLEMVLTHPAYRGRGLVRRQMENFERAVKERGYDVSFIWGIPYYYRQYGYAYAIEGEFRESLPSWNIPFSPAGAVTVRLRQAAAADIPFLMQAYSEMTAPLDIFLERTSAHWRFLLEAAKHPVKILEDASTGEPRGYVTLQHRPEVLNVLESGLSHGEAALSLLQMLRAEAAPQVLIAGPACGALAALAVNLGSRRVPGGQWLMRFPDVAKLLMRIGPAMERRLAASAWRGLTRALTINLFRHSYRLRFESGRLSSVDSLGFVDSSMGADGGDVLIPPEAFVRLVTGFRSLEELSDAWPDILVKPPARALMEVLFPRLSAHLYTPYHRADLSPC